jgi:hypothetical protein
MVPTVRSVGHVRDARAMHTETRGGVSDTDVKEFAVIPIGTPSATPATAATPVGNLAYASRSARELRLSDGTMRRPGLFAEPRCILHRFLTDTATWIIPADPSAGQAVVGGSA